MAATSKNLNVITHICYGFLALATLSTAGIGLFSLPIFSIIICYVKRGEAKGTHLESHFNWIIKTFWYPFIILAIAAAFCLLIKMASPLLALFLILVIAFTVSIWYLYRITVGWLDLYDEKEIHQKSSFPYLRKKD